MPLCFETNREIKVSNHPKTRSFLRNIFYDFGTKMLSTFELAIILYRFEWHSFIDRHKQKHYQNGLD